jgi:hypothetical protein
MNLIKGSQAENRLLAHGAKVVTPTSFARPGGLEAAVAYFIAVSSSMPLGNSQYLRVALIAILPLVPVLLSRWFRSWREITLTLLVVFSAGSGMVLAWLNTGQGRSWDQWTATSAIFQVLALVAAAAAAAWACRAIGFQRFLVVWCVGAIISTPFVGGRFLDNPWKFGLALPVSVLVLYIASQFSKRAVVGAFLLLMAVSTVFSFRSWLLILGAALLVYLFANIARKSATNRSNAKQFMLVVILVAGMSLAGNLLGDLALRGSLGQYAQTRTLQSLEASGNPFLGSRAEWGGALALMKSEPLGIGAGVGPSGNDWSTAIESLVLADELKEKSNVADSFRSGRIEFHSMLWNFWSNFGIPGLVLMLFVLLIHFRAVLCLPTMGGLGSAFPTAAISVLVIGSMWDILFSPTNSWTLAVAVVFSLLAIRGWNESHRQDRN